MIAYRCGRYPVLDLQLVYVYCLLFDVPGAHEIRRIYRYHEAVGVIIPGIATDKHVNQGARLRNENIRIKPVLDGRDGTLGILI